MSGKVKPSSRARTRRTPMRPDVARAASLYERFSGHQAEGVGVVDVPALPKVAACVGELDGVMYTTVRDGIVEKYLHKFARDDKPLLCVSPDGTQLLLVGGRFRFTELGIVDRSDKKHRHAR